MRSSITMVVAGVMFCLAPMVNAQVSFLDDFSSGINPAWWQVKQFVVFSQTYAGYTLDSSHGDLRLSNPGGGGYVYRAIKFYFIPQVVGNFTMKVVFRNAQLTLTPNSYQSANQLNLAANIGSSVFATTRDNAMVEGDNYHVYRNPPGQTYGVTPSTAVNGTLEIHRTGSVTSGYFDGSLIYSANLGTGNMQGIWFSLDNNMTNDPTSVTFDDFLLEADNIIGIPEPGGIGVAMLCVAFLLPRRRCKADDADETR